MKTYVLTISRLFPKNHKNSGQETWFIQKIQNAINGYKESVVTCYDKNNKETDILIRDKKIHTIRSNYELWQKRISEIQKGNAILSIRYWIGKPYNSKQVEICKLDKNSGVGVQPIFMHSCHATLPNTETFIRFSDLSYNDGLSPFCFVEWFKKYDLSKQMVIIHFTSFRY